MYFKYLSQLLFLLSFSILLQAQEVNELPHNEEEVNTVGYSTQAQAWLPGLLNASSNPLYTTILFNGRIFSWNLRGENDFAKIVDGIDWQAGMLQWNGSRLFNGLNNVYSAKEVLVNGNVSNNGYWTHSNISIVSSENTEEKKSIAIATGLSNVNNLNHTKSIQLIGRTGRLSSNYKMSYGVKLEDAPLGVLPIGFKKTTLLFYSIDRQWNANHFGFTFLWNYVDQGKSATAVNEMFDLSKQRNYNPSWGWYHQQPYFPNTRQSNVPVISFRFQKKWKNTNTIDINNGFAFGKEAQSNLEWTNAADPRPDYYKYLPSFTLDTALSAKLYDWYQQHPASLQVQFDQLERVNKASALNRSFYIVNQQNNALRMLHGSVMYSQLFKNRLKMQTGFQYTLDQIHYYNTIKDLLGGDFFYNYNGWMNDEDLALSFQFDIAAPNKKIKQGERWGADYTMRSFQFKPWVQFQQQGPVIEAAIAMGYGFEGLARIGNQQNGLYANSKGNTGFTVFSTADIKAQLLYKLSGRIYFKSILFAKWKAPQYKSVFIDPDINAFHSPYSIQAFNYGADMSMYYRAPNFKTALSFYQQINNNETENRMFYHDAFALFVYGIIGNMHSAQNGVEFVAETSILQNIKCSYVATFSQSYFLDNANFQFLDVNNLAVKDAGLLQIKNLPKNNGPKYVNAISLFYQPFYGFTVGVTTLYAQERPVALNLFRRSEWVKNKVDPITWGQLLQTQYLTDKFVTNIFISKFFQLKPVNPLHKIYRWNASVSGRNILNALIPVLAYEQTRFDYLRFNKEKFAVKYLMDAGTSYSFRLQLQIQ
jgi:hypothetical protein